MENTYDKTAAKWDAMLCDPESWQNHQEQFRRFHWFMKRALKIGNRTKSFRLLDLGCGTGEASWPLWKRVASVTFMDRSADMLRLARNKFPKGIFVRGDAKAPPFLDEEFDVIVSRGAVISTLESVEEAEAMLEGCWRILRSGGYMLFDFTTRTSMTDEKLPEKTYHLGFDRRLMELMIRKLPNAAVLAYDGTDAHAMNRILIRKA